MFLEGQRAQENSRIFCVLTEIRSRDASAILSLLYTASIQRILTRIAVGRECDKSR
jgi:hypothetical protein